MLTLRIKEICRDKGITLNDLAEKIGVSQPSISGIATGQNRLLTHWKNLLLP